MEAKDIITATVASLALIVSVVSLWRAMRADRRSSKVEFEQEKQAVINLFLENKLSQQDRVRKLTQLRAQVPATSSISDNLDYFIDTFEDTVSDIEYIQEQLEEIPASTPDDSASVAVKTLRGLGERYKTYAQAWDGYVTEYAQVVRRLTDLEAGLEQLAADSEGAEEERQQIEEELRRLKGQLAERAQSLADETEEMVAEDEDEAT